MKVLISLVTWFLLWNVSVGQDLGDVCATESKEVRFSFEPSEENLASFFINIETFFDGAIDIGFHHSKQVFVIIRLSTATMLELEELEEAIEKSDNGGYGVQVKAPPIDDGYIYIGSSSKIMASLSIIAFSSLFVLYLLFKQEKYVVVAILLFVVPGVVLGASLCANKVSISVILPDTMDVDLIDVSIVKVTGPPAFGVKFNEPYYLQWVGSSDINYIAYTVVDTQKELTNNTRILKGPFPKSLGNIPIEFPIEENRNYTFTVVATNVGGDTVVTLDVPIGLLSNTRGVRGTQDDKYFKGIWSIRTENKPINEHWLCSYDVVEISDFNYENKTWKPVPCFDRRASYGPLYLTHGGLYYWTMKAYNNVTGTTVYRRAQDYVVWDTTNPVTSGPYVHGPRIPVPETSHYYLDEYWTNVRIEFEAHWTEYTDPDNAIREYEWRVGNSSDCGGEILPWFDPHESGFKDDWNFEAISRRLDIIPETVPDGEYWISLRIWNTHGLKQDVCTGKYIIDTSPPVIHEAAFYYDQVESMLHVKWDVEDNHNVLHSQFRIDFVSPNDPIILWTDTKVNTTVSEYYGNVEQSLQVQLDLPSQRDMKPRMRARDYSGSYSEECCDDIPTLLIDLTAPDVKAADAYDGPVIGKDYFAQSYNDRIIFYWSDFVDLESGIDYYEVAVGSSPTLLDDIHPFTKLYFEDNEDFRANITLDLVQNSTYYSTVRAVNKDTFPKTSENVTTNGVLVDITDPVMDVGSVTIKSITLKSDSLFDIYMQWGPVEDPESGIDTLRLCVGNSTHVDSVFCAFVSTSASDTTFSAENVESDVDYFATLFARNQALTEVSDTSDPKQYT